MLESEIQRRVIKVLENADWLQVKLIQTTMNGIPDLMALKKGKALFIEVKQPGKLPDPLQQYRHKQLRDAGFTVLVISNPNDLQPFV